MDGGFPDNHYICIIHSRTYIYNYLELPFNASQFIYTYRVFDHTSLVKIIIYMYIPCICLHINICNNTNCFFPKSVVVDYYIHFFVILIYLASARCNPTKPANRRSYIIHEEGGLVSLGSRYRNTRHSSSCCRNVNGESYDEEGIEVYSGDESRGHRCLETIHYSSINHRGRENSGHRYQETIHSTSSNCGGCGHRSILTSPYSYRNCRGYVDIGVYRSQETIHYSSLNRGIRVSFEGRGEYRSETIHYYSHNQCKWGRFLTFSGENVGGDENMKHPSSVITMNLLQNFYTPIQISNFNLLFSHLGWEEEHN